MEKKKRLFNGFDVAIVLLVIAAVLVWIFINRAPAEESSFQGDTATYFLEVTNLTYEQATQIQAGDSLLEGGKGYDLGTVLSVEINPYEMRMENRDEKSFFYAQVPDRYTLTITVETQFQETDRDILAGGQYAIKGGNSLSFTGPGYSFTSATILGFDMGD